MKVIFAFWIFLLFASTPVFAQDQADSNDIIAKMQTELDLSQDQVFHITPIIQRYTVLFADLQKSINDGTINPSAIDSQRQGLEDTETQELSQYLKPYQLSEWRDMQSQMAQANTDNSDGDADTDQYSNLPNRGP